MNKNLSISFGLLALVLTPLLIVSLALPALASPPGQGGDILPTPTLFPVEDVDYTLMSYGGSDEPQTFTHEPVDGFTFTDTTAVSFYPRGMRISVGVTSEHGDITSVQWVLRRENKFGTRVSAEFDSTLEQWVATPWEDGGQAAGTEGNFFWRAIDSAGNSVETEPQFIIYWDPLNVWYRMESDLIVTHWYGIGDDPDEFARGMAEYMAALYPRWEGGFGRGLSYKPLALIYPNAQAYAARFLGGIVSANQGGVTVPGEGLITQRIRSEPTGPIVTECLWTRPAEFWTFERRVEEIYGTVAHETTHLYQGDVLGGADGPTWWSEGQAEWFSNNTPEYADERLHNLSTLQNMPTLQDEVGYQMNEADGCYRLAYDAGASFINWLLTNYGGLDAHRQIIELLKDGKTTYDAIAEVSGKPFLEIENEWRAYHGFRALTPEEIDPSLAMEAYEDPVLKVGDSVMIPANPPIANIYKEPAPNALVIAACWANMEAEVLEIGQLNDEIYVKVDCMGQVGWMTRDQLIAPGS